MKVQLDPAPVLEIFFPEIISNNLTELGLALKNKIIEINLSKKDVLTKKTNKRNIHDRLHLNTETTKRNVFFSEELKSCLTRSTVEKHRKFRLQVRKK